MVQVVHQALQHRRQGSGTHDAEILTQRVENGDGQTLFAVLRQTDAVVHLWAAEREVLCLVKAASACIYADVLFKGLLRRQTAGSGAAKLRCRNVVIAVHAGNFLRQIAHAGDIRAVERNDDFIAFDDKAQTIQVSDDFLAAQVNAEQRVHLCALQRQTLVLVAGCININHTVDDFAGTQHLNQFTSAVDSVQGHARIQTLLKTAGSFGAHAQLLCRDTDGCTVEVCRLKDNGLGLFGDFTLIAAHDACNSGSSGAVGDAQHILVERMVFTVQCLDAFAILRAANDNLAVLQAGVVKCMHRLAVFQHNIVCDINNVVDRTNTGSVQTLAHPSRRRLNLDVLHQTCGIARAQIGCFHFHGQLIVDVAADALDNRLVQLELALKGSGGLACQTDYAEAVRTVGSDFEVGHVFIQTNQSLDVHTDRCAFRHEQQAIRIAVRDFIQGQTQFLVRAHHTVGRYAAQLALGNLYAARQVRLVQSNRNNTADLCVRSTGDNLNRLILAHVYLTDNQMVRVRMRYVGQNFACNYIFNFIAEINDFFHLGTGHGHLVRIFLVGNSGHIYKFGKPAHWQLHDFIPPKVKYIPAIN